MICVDKIKYIKDMLDRSDEILAHDREMEMNMQLLEDMKATEIKTIQSRKEQEEQERQA